ncbi:MAG: NAD-dependent epimerase/dehydratase family protein, partial [Synergistaceae bacterium]|nr:NAD-dependent epimerase/dehydratase family protein [Synergistaceae bacterium]
MRVLITGGAGYIGSHTNRMLAGKGIDTVIIDDLSDGHEEAAVAGRLIRGDFGDAGLLDGVMGMAEFDAVVHFAAFASVP